LNGDRIVGLSLTERQQEVLQLFADGEALREIALELGIAHQTVKNLMIIVRERLGAKSSTHAVAIALRNELIA